MKYKFPAKVTDGKIVHVRHDYFNKYVKTFEGQQVEITINRKPHRKSLNQNNYFHGPICEAFADYIGCTTLEAKEILKQHFLKREVVSKNTGKSLEFVPSIATLNKDEMRKFIDDCMNLGIGMGIVIPDPSEVIY